MCARVCGGAIPNLGTLGKQVSRSQQLIIVCLCAEDGGMGRTVASAFHVNQHWTDDLVPLVMFCGKVTLSSKICWNASATYTCLAVNEAPYVSYAIV